MPSQLQSGIGWVMRGGERRKGVDTLRPTHATPGEHTLLSVGRTCAWGGGGGWRMEGGGKGRDAAAAAVFF